VSLAPRGGGRALAWCSRSCRSVWSHHRRPRRLPVGLCSLRCGPPRQDEQRRTRAGPISSLRKLAAICPFRHRRTSAGKRWLTGLGPHSNGAGRPRRALDPRRRSRRRAVAVRQGQLRARQGERRDGRSRRHDASMAQPPTTTWRIVRAIGSGRLRVTLVRYHVSPHRAGLFALQSEGCARDAGRARRRGETLSGRCGCVIGKPMSLGTTGAAEQEHDCHQNNGGQKCQLCRSRPHASKLIRFAR
jgi:hypothetical protein